MKKLFAVCCYLLTFPLIAADTSAWEKILSQVTDSVVSIRVNAVRTFDTENSMATQATGFVVDAKQGIILTNRHVVNPGPVTAEAIFSNSEEIELRPIYRDPVHDFGFFKYNPDDLKFIQPKALRLNAGGAQIGDDIRLIGNDSGEHMSILSGTLARLDRSAPKYRRGGYNDFNTFYYQSAADTSGGSSGSPVVNIKGEVVALNAGGNNRSSSSFFLPLYKVTRALNAVQQDQPIARGTIQTTLEYHPYDQVRRLGLPLELEQAFRDKGNGNGLLVVKNTVPEGPAHNALRPGDIIVSLRSKNNKEDYVSRYETFEIFLDEHVNETIELDIARQGTPMTVTLTVENLHEITPDEFLQIAGGVFNDFSYQLARQTNLAAKGVYIASSGFMFSNFGINRGNVIQAINNTEINNLDDFEKALGQLKQNEYFTLKFVSIGAPKNQRIASVKFQTYWHSSERCARDDSTGSWNCRELVWQQASKPADPTKIKFSKFSDKQTAKIARSLVMLNSDLPYHVDGQNYDHYSGTGLVLDAKAGLVLADRNTVPVKMAEVSIGVAGQAEIPAKIVFVHPLHSYVLLQYDPKLLSGDPLRSAPLSSKPINAGDPIWLVGYQSANRLISEKLNISSYEALELPMPSIPQFRATNSKGVIINNPPVVASGALIDKRGKVRSWWTNFAANSGASQTLDRGLPIEHIINIRDQWLEKQKIDIYSLEVELYPITLASARNLGLDDKWMEKLQDSDDKQQAFKIIRRGAGSEAREKLRDGDLLLAIDGNTIHSYTELDQLVRKQQVTVSVWRDGQQLDIPLKTRQLMATDTDNIYLWAGALLQTPHRALAMQHGIESEGVYVSWYWYGSPANRYNLRPLHRITEFEGEAITSLEQFITLSDQYQDKKYVTIRLLDLIGRESIITLKQDHRYWPTQRIFWDGKNWLNQQVSSLESNAP